MSSSKLWFFVTIFASVLCSVVSGAETTSSQGMCACDTEDVFANVNFDSGDSSATLFQIKVKEAAITAESDECGKLFLGCLYAQLTLNLFTEKNTTGALAAADRGIAQVDTLASGTLADSLKTLLEYGRGVVLMESGDTTAAISSFRLNESQCQKLTEQLPDAPHILKLLVEARTGLVNAYRYDNPEEARKVAASTLDTLRILNDLEPSDTVYLRKTAGALSELAQFSSDDGNTTQALNYYEQGLDLTSEMLHNEPEDDALKLHVTELYYRIAQCCYDLYQYKKGFPYVEEAVTRCRIRYNERNPGARLDLHRAQVLKGDYLDTVGQTSQALQNFQDAYRLLIEASDDEITSDIQLEFRGYTLNRIPYLLADQGKTTEALTAAVETVSNAENWVSQKPTDSHAVGHLGSTHVDLANIRRLKGDIEGTAEAVEIAYKLLEPLAMADPAYRQNLFWAQASAVMVQRALGRKTEALAATRAMLKLAEDDFREQREDAQSQDILACALAFAGDAHLSVGGYQEATPFLSRSVAVAERVHVAYPEVVEYNLTLAWALTSYGEAIAPGNPAEARKYWERSVQLLKSASSETRATCQLELVKALLHLGKTDEARQLARRLMDQGFAEPDFIAACGKHGIHSDQ